MTHTGQGCKIVPAEGLTLEYSIVKIWIETLILGIKKGIPKPNLLYQCQSKCMDIGILCLVYSSLLGCSLGFTKLSNDVLVQVLPAIHPFKILQSSRSDALITD